MNACTHRIGDLCPGCLCKPCACPVDETAVQAMFALASSENQTPVRN
jgi:hypothetical protein